MVLSSSSFQLKTRSLADATTRNVLGVGQRVYATNAQAKCELGQARYSFGDEAVAGFAIVGRLSTGLLLDPYFSATKIAWILDRDPALRTRAEKGELAFGTMETFLVWRLTNGEAHVSDVTNASRTLLYDFNKRDWSDEMCALLRVPRPLLWALVANATSAGLGMLLRELTGWP